MNNSKKFYQTPDVAVEMFTICGDVVVCTISDKGGQVGVGETPGGDIEF